MSWFLFSLQFCLISKGGVPLIAVREDGRDLECENVLETLYMISLCLFWRIHALNFVVI